MSAIDILIILLILAWIGGFSLNVMGSAIHLLLVLALAALVFRLATGRRL